MEQIYIIKNDGSKELLNVDKIHSHLSEACKGLNVSQIDIVKGARLKFFNGMKSASIQDSLIQSAQDLITGEHPDYEIAAGRLLNQKIRKEVYNQYEPKSFKDCVKARINSGLYSEDLLGFTDEELEYLGSKIKYSLDEELSYSSLHQMYSKYILKQNGKATETVQEVFMLIPMAIFHKSKDLKLIVDGYQLLSQRKIALPTPIMNGARTPYKKYISCNLINAGDSAESLAKAAEAIMRCTANKSGLGLNMSFVRGLGARIGNPERVKHTGILPLIKAYEASTASLQQISRGGSVTITLPFYHYESELFSQLSDSKGTVETRARHTDQSIIINKWFLKKALANEHIYLFHMNEVPELYDALGSEDEFDKKYKKYAKSVPAKHKKKVNAFELLDLFLYERMITGRLYFVFADNSHKGSFKENLYMSNLCCFVGNTPVSTYNGIKQIKDLVVGDMVLSCNEKTMQTEFKIVRATRFIKQPREVVKVICGKDEVICTPDHKFFTNRGWIEAQHLLSSDTIFKLGKLNNGEQVKVIKLEEKMYVYDIDVADNHNFFANNLCAHNCEILVPSHSLDGFNHITQKHNDIAAEIGVCILGSVNMGYAKIDDIPKAANFLVRFLDCLIDESDYGMAEIEYAAVNRRTLGIGISNLFGSLAKSKLFYNTKEAREFVNDFVESLSWHLHKTSIELASEKGKCNLFDDTIYSDYVFPHERFENPEFKPKLDWDCLRNDLQKFGIRNSSLMAIAPAGNCILKTHKIKTYEGNLNLEDICQREGIDLTSLQKGWYDLKTPIKLPTKDGDSVSRKFYYNGEEKVYKIELENGDILQITKNHKLLVRGKNGQYYWKKACDLKEGDDIQTTDSYKAMQVLKMSHPEFNGILKFLAEVPEFKGRILNGLNFCPYWELKDIKNFVKMSKEGWVFRCSLEKFKIKYGKFGEALYEEFKMKAATTEENFKKRYGDEWHKKWSDFRKNSVSTTLEAMQRRHGKEEGAKRHKEFLAKQKAKSRFHTDYYINELGYTQEEAEEAVKKIAANGTLEFHIEKWGEELGRIKHAELCKKHQYQNTLPAYIERYGEEEGTLKYWENCLAVGKYNRTIIKPEDFENIKRLFVVYRRAVSRNTAQSLRRAGIECPKGLSIDHKVSVLWGFQNGIPAYIIGSLHNIDFIPIGENAKKGSSNSMEPNELIKNFFNERV